VADFDIDAYPDAMHSMATVAEYRAVQTLAMEVLEELGPTIGSEDTEFSIAFRATEALARRGLTETWYHGCPAFVLLGSRSCLSISGREYEPALEEVGQVNLVTVDLSPKRNEIWGDCARSFFIEGGRHTSNPTLSEFQEGASFLKFLHDEMTKFVDAHTTFHQLFEWASREISGAGFENLDFAGNVGHSIETRPEKRRYVETANHIRLSEVPFFTFEPHVRRISGRWGFKHENIFYFGSAPTVAQL
jgi:Xaa-Pro aminopeptidase